MSDRDLRLAPFGLPLCPGLNWCSFGGRPGPALYSSFAGGPEGKASGHGHVEPPQNPLAAARHLSDDGNNIRSSGQEFAFRYLHKMQSFVILKCFSTAAQTISLVMLDVPGMHLSMSVVHSTNVLFSLLRGSGRAASA
jgi:hypothetical protein